MLQKLKISEVVLSCGLTGAVTMASLLIFVTLLHLVILAVLFIATMEKVSFKDKLIPRITLTHFVYDL